MLGFTISVKVSGSTFAAGFKETRINKTLKDLCASLFSHFFIFTNFYFYSLSVHIGNDKA